MNIRTIKLNQSLHMRWLLVSLVAALVLLLAACQPAAPAAIQIPVMTEAPAVAAEEPVSAKAEIMPSVTVSDQEIVDGKVMIAEVVSDGPAWMVIHAQADGKPGPVLGFSALADGLNKNVIVEIDVAQATETLYAMLHTDAGTLGQYEFPGDDVPVKVDDKVITPPFAVTGGMTMVTPSVMVSEQEIMDGKVMVAEVVSDGPGWLVIHAQADGKPGPVLGYTAVADGINKNVIVEIDVANATETVYAMLHTDAGTLGQYEFPGDDVPVKVDDQVVTPAFDLLQDMSAATTTVVMDKTGFGTKELTIAVGTTVVWVNNSSAPHTVTADDGLFDSGNMPEGATFEYTFTEAGEYPYYCLYHGSAGGSGMAATVIVTAP